MTECEKLYWRVGRKVGRTIYAVIDQDNPEGDPLIGVMDTPALAHEAVATHNAVLVAAETRWRDE